MLCVPTKALKGLFPPDSLCHSAPRWSSIPVHGDELVPHASFLRFRTASVARAQFGHSPLHCAAGSGRLEVAAILLASGAEPNAQREDGKAPLHLAAAAGSWGTVKALLQAGAALDAPDLVRIVLKSNTNRACGSGLVCPLLSPSCSNWRY